MKNAKQAIYLKLKTKKEKNNTTHYITVNYKNTQLQFLTK